MLGINRTDLNDTGTTYKNGFPVTLPLNVGNPITEPMNFGNSIPSSGTNENAVDWTPSPAHFGNDIGGSSPPPPPSGSFLASIEAIHGGTNSTTGATGGAASINTTDATLLVAVVRAADNTPVITDSANNTWNYGPVYEATGTACFIYIAWVSNPVTSTTHTFSPTAVDGSCDVFAFTGGTAWTLDVSAGAVAATPGTTVLTGSLSLSGDGEIIVAGIGSNGSESSATVSNGFSGGITGDAADEALPQLLSSSPELGGGAYLIDSADTLISTTFSTGTSNTDWTWVIAAFKAA